MTSFSIIKLYSLLVLLQFPGIGYADSECDNKYVLFEETVNTTADGQQTIIKLFSTSDEKTWNSIAASNYSIHKECAINLSSSCGDPVCIIAHKATTTAPDVDSSTLVHNSKADNTPTSIKTNPPTINSTPTDIPTTDEINTLSENTSTVSYTNYTTTEVPSNETADQGRGERNKKTAIIVASILFGSLGVAAVVYFIGRKIEGLIKSDTYRFPE